MHPEEIPIAPEKPSEAELTIGDLAARTGVTVSTLRTWEARYGVPSPVRVPSGHRRYRAEDVDLVLETLRHRTSGLTMPVAAERARRLAATPEPSVFAGLRRRHPALRVQSLRKPVVLALCRAIEDECAAGADRPLLFASFQSTEHYRASAHRWRELSRTARGTLVFADFTDPPDLPSAAAVPEWRQGPVEVPVPFDSPVNREWVLVCDSEDSPGCVVGWERPSDAGGEDRSRAFETLWSVDPSVVRDAARICARLSEDFLPGSRFEHWEALEETPPPSSPEARRASGVLDRMLDYLTRAGQPGF